MRFLTPVTWGLVVKRLGASAKMFGFRASATLTAYICKRQIFLYRTPWCGPGRIIVVYCFPCCHDGERAGKTRDSDEWTLRCLQNICQGSAERSRKVLVQEPVVRTTNSLRRDARVNKQPRVVPPSPDSLVFWGLNFKFPSPASHCFFNTQIRFSQRVCRQIHSLSLNRRSPASTDAHFTVFNV